MVPPAPRKCNQPARSALHRKQFAAHRPAQRIGLRIPYNDSASPSAVRASHPVQRPRSASRKCNLSVEVRASHPVQRPRIALRASPSRSAHASQYFALVSFGSWNYFFQNSIYICLFSGPNLMAHPSYWLRCENLICAPRFDSGTSRVIVVGPRRRPCCNDDFTTAEK